MKKKWYKRWWGILLLVLVGLALILALAFSFLVASYVIKISKGEMVNPSSFENQEKYDAVDEDSPQTGSINPKVTIVEFGDFTCPYCKQSHSVIREIGLKNKKDIRLIYRDYFDYDNNSEALRLSMAARCAGEQGLFWPMYDKLYQYQGRISNVTNLAVQIGVHKEKFVDCLESQKYLDDIKKDVHEGIEMEIKGTPTWFINGYKFSGNIPEKDFKALVNTLLEFNQ